MARGSYTCKKNFTGRMWSGGARVSEIISCSLAPPKPVQSVNEVEHSGGMAGIFLPEEWLSVCEKSLTVWRWIRAGSGVVSF